MYLNLSLKKAIPIVLGICLSLPLWANNEFGSCDEYIARFKDLAIAEMQATGIPASVKLAQAILESNHGNSSLAKNANNHFGVKCKEEWSGAKFYHKDDDYVNGVLVPSCFRKYSSPEESFHDHSMFLTTRHYYTALFQNEPFDYKSWCHGLKKAGYATSKDYDKNLIRIIEKYKLDRFDKMSARIIPRLQNMKVKNFKNETDPFGSTGGTLQLSDEMFYTAYFNVPADRNTFKVKGLKASLINDKQSLEIVSLKSGISMRKLERYNDFSETNQAGPGMICFLEPKKRKGNPKIHQVRPGETIWMVSQFYGIQLKTLLNDNHIKIHEEVLAGEKLYIFKPAPHTPLTCSRNDKVAEREYVGSQILEASPAPIIPQGE
jgi:hypothetical protein